MVYLALAGIARDPALYSAVIQVYIQPNIVLAGIPTGPVQARKVIL